MLELFSKGDEILEGTKNKVRQASVTNELAVVNLIWEQKYSPNNFFRSFPSLLSIFAYRPEQGSSKHIPLEMTGFTGTRQQRLTVSHVQHLCHPVRDTTFHYIAHKTPHHSHQQVLHHLGLLRKKVFQKAVKSPVKTMLCVNDNNHMKVLMHYS